MNLHDIFDPLFRSPKSIWIIFAILITVLPIVASAAEPDLARGFANPSNEYKPRVYWWWLYNRVDKEGITRDLEAFHDKGISGVNLICTGGYAGLEPLPGLDFLGPEWRDCFRYAVKEAKRLDIEIGFNLAGGWVMIGPWVTPDNAMKKMVQSEVTVTGPSRFFAKLPQPEIVNGYYHDVWVQAFPKRTIEPYEVIELGSRLQPDGSLLWDVPEGEWIILRTGYTQTGSKWGAYPEGDTFKGGEGFQIDYLSKAALDDHFDHLGKLVIDEAAKAGGKLDYLWSDSWECGKLTWTQDFPDQFRKYRGYDMKPYAPALAGHTVINEDVTQRFIADVNRTIQDCIADNFYGHFADLCHQNGMAMRNEAAGPGDLPMMDSLKNLGRCDGPAGEFWMSGQYKFPGGYNLNLKQTASAAHIYGKKMAIAEAFTQQERDKTHWYYGPSDMKPFGDSAFCEGINEFMLHQATCQPPSDGKPGYEFCAGQHWTPNVTWWDQSDAFFTYLSRCQYLLQQGLFVGDVCFYLGENAPSIAPPKYDNPALGSGYDCDYCNAEVLLTRMSVKDGRIVLPDGMSYRLLVLQHCASPVADIANGIGGIVNLNVSPTPSTAMSVEVIEKIRDLVRSGATVIGAPPDRAAGLRGYPECDDQVRAIANEVWGDSDGKTITEHKYGKGRVIWGKTPREVLTADGVPPDFTYEVQENRDPAFWMWHEADGDNPPACDRIFKCEITIPADRKIVSAHIGLTADNAFELKVNGTAVCGGSEWQTLSEADLTPYLAAGRNELTLHATNTDVGPAGVLICGDITLDNGGLIRLDAMDAKWLSSVDGKDWATVHVIGQNGVAPWRTIDAYTAPLDYIHRSAGDAEIYFVRNRRSRDEAHECTFRVGGKQPEIWDPVSGVMRKATAFTHANGYTSVPLEFAPYQSFFVVFRKATGASGKGKSNFPELAMVQKVDGPWEVQFDPAWGGPKSVEFPALISWTKRPEDGIKYYSGKATYRKAFDLGTKEAGRICLDLGNVRHLAEVRLNGKKLGVLWTAPWRVDITDAVQPTGNVLEVDVINLWANRVIGDLALPKEQRVTHTHDAFRFDMITKDTALLESGLLGPVRVTITDTP